MMFDRSRRPFMVAFRAAIGTSLALIALVPGLVAAQEASREIRVLVAYYSLSGNTAEMAAAVAQGAGAVPGTVVLLKKIDEVTVEDLEAADGIALGSATYYANIPGEMKVILDRWSWKLGVDFTDKAGGAFATGGGQVGGKEHVIVSLLLFMLNNRMVVAGPLYHDQQGIWAEIGAGAMTGPLDPGVGEHELDSARRLGERVARVAARMKQTGGENDEKTKTKRRPEPR